MDKEFQFSSTTFTCPSCLFCHICGKEAKVKVCYQTISSPHSFTSTLLHFHTPSFTPSTLLHFHTPSLPHSFTSTLLHFHTPSLPHSFTSTLLHFHTPSLPHSFTSTLLHFHTPSLPHSFTSTLLHFHCHSLSFFLALFLCVYLLILSPFSSPLPFLCLFPLLCCLFLIFLLYFSLPRFPVSSLFLPQCVQCSACHKCYHRGCLSDHRSHTLHGTWKCVSCTRCIGCKTTTPGKVRYIAALVSALSVLQDLCVGGVGCGLMCPLVVVFIKLC